MVKQHGDAFHFPSVLYQGPPRRFMHFYNVQIIDAPIGYCYVYLYCCFLYNCVNLNKIILESTALMQADAFSGRRRLLIIDLSIIVVFIVFLIGKILYASGGIIIYIFPFPLPTVVNFLLSA